MIRSALVFLSLNCLVLSGGCFADSPSSMCGLVPKAMMEASAIRGLEPKSAVPCRVSGRTEIEGFLRESVKERLPSQKIQLEEVAYKAIGLIPEQFDYVPEIISIYLNQLGGYYDPEKHHFIMAKWIPESLQFPIAVHELTHALQDQYFNLSQIIDSRIDNSDLLLAHSALVEGDATAVMTDYERRKVGARPLAKEPNIDELIQAGAETIGKGSETPESIKALITFPYTAGLRFVHALLRRGGYNEIDKAFERLPRSTKEILHPEIYLANQTSWIDVPLSDLKTRAGIEDAIYSDTLGEFTISVLLCSGTVDSAKCKDAATGWSGDRIALFQRNQDNLIAIWDTRWESADDAKDFSAQYRKLLQKLYQKEVGEERIKLTDTKEILIQSEGSRVILSFWIKRSGS